MKKSTLLVVALIIVIASFMACNNAEGVETPVASEPASSSEAVSEEVSSEEVSEEVSEEPSEEVYEIVDGIQTVKFDTYDELDIFSHSLEDTVVVSYSFFPTFEGAGQAVLYNGAHYTIPENHYLTISSQKNIGFATTTTEDIYVGAGEFNIYGKEWSIYVNTTGTDIEIPILIYYTDGTEDTITIYVTKEWE